MPRHSPTPIVIERLCAWYGAAQVLDDVSMTIPASEVTSIIGPSGCGKSTLIRCFNRMHELVPGSRMSGGVRLGDLDAYAPQVDPMLVRQRVGMVFQTPTPFPTMSIRDNVLAGIRLTGRPKGIPEATVETKLRQVALWDEVKDHLDRPATSLGLGAQQRLCIARALAVEPEVLLLDEPCYALDPIATTRIEDLVHSLRENYTIVLVTHNMRQAARVSQWTAFLLNGRLVEFSETGELFTSPSDKRTEDYITGKFD